MQCVMATLLAVRDSSATVRAPAALGDASLGRAAARLPLLSAASAGSQLPGHGSHAAYQDALTRQCPAHAERLLPQHSSSHHGTRVSP